MDEDEDEGPQLRVKVRAKIQHLQQVEGEGDVI